MSHFLLRNQLAERIYKISEDDIPSKYSARIMNKAMGKNPCIRTIRLSQFHFIFFFLFCFSLRNPMKPTIYDGP